MDKYEYLISQVILPSNFTYSPLGKALIKQIEKQVDALKHLKLSIKIKSRGVSC